jgi:hypothetical protein
VCVCVCVCMCRRERESVCVCVRKESENGFCVRFWSNQFPICGFSCILYVGKEERAKDGEKFSQNENKRKIDALE